jgi:hypothetical protein
MENLKRGLGVCQPNEVGILGRRKMCAGIETLSFMGCLKKEEKFMQLEDRLYSR